jgi:RHS repeat-associated protein
VSQKAKSPTEHFQGPVRELANKRDGRTRVFELEGGRRVVDAYLTPINYRTEDGWQPIRNAILRDPDDPRSLRTSGNAWSVRFRPLSEGITLTTPEGDVSMAPVENRGGAPRVVSDGQQRLITPTTANEVADSSAIAAPGVVEYADVWRDVDLRYEVRGSGLKEHIVLGSTNAPSEFLFDITGSSVMPDGEGGLRLAGDVGRVFAIPPPRVIAADGSEPTAESRVRYELREAEGEADTRVALVIDETWLAGQPTASFPLTIDPEFFGVLPTLAKTLTSNGVGQFNGSPVGLGVNSANGAVVRAAIHFDHYEQYINTSNRVYFAQLNIERADGGPSTPTTAIDVYEQGSEPTTYSQVGTTGSPIGSQTWPLAFPFNIKVAKQIDRWVTQGLQDQWFGIRGTETGTQLRFYDFKLTMSVYTPPPLSNVTNIADIASGAKIATTTPLLQAATVPQTECGGLPAIEFQITTSPAPGSGLVQSFSGQQTGSQPVEWQVPPGALHEGVTYWAWALTNCWPNDFSAVPSEIPPLSRARRFTVDLGLGEGGPSPTDEVGAVPARASKPSAGAPGPSLPVSKATVNLVDGNLSVAVGTKMMGTLSGGASLSFAYNSLMVGNEGLLAEFFNDTNGDGQISTGDLKVGERTDPTVSFDWGTFAKAVEAHDPTNALARWTGSLNVPSTAPANTSWQLGAISSNRLRASVAGTQVLNNWTSHQPESFPVFGSTFNATSGTPVAINVEWGHTSGKGVALVYLRDVTNNKIYALSASWLTRSPKILPHGWTMNAVAGAAQWVGLVDNGTSAALVAADGTAYEFVSQGNGAYAPPVEAPNDLLTAGNDGRFVLQDAAGSTYTFRSDGLLESLVTAGDDRNPAALSYTYSGSPPLLRTITDPVSARSLTLSYGADAGCVGTPPPGLLCKIAYWDATATDLTYDGFGRFAALTNPGDVVYQFGYDGVGRLISIRDPLANAAIAAGLRSAGDLTTTTQVAYSAGRVSTVTQPAPVALALRPQRTYTYNDAAKTGEVDVAGVFPDTGFVLRVQYDDRLRIVQRTDAANDSTTFSWDSKDRLVGTTDPANVHTTTVYDAFSRPKTIYGPAAASSFDANGLPTTTVPTTTKVYDENMPGLAATYWTNPYLAGGPALHGTGLGTAGAMDKDWASTPPVTPGAGGWSARFTGLFTPSSENDYVFQTQTKGSRVRVWIDDILVVDHNQAEPPTGWASTTGAGVHLTAASHRMRVDMVDTTGPSGLQVLWKPQTSGTFTVLAGTLLSPNYGLETRSTDPDGKVATTEYADAAAGIGPHHGLVTAMVDDPTPGLNLRTTTTYETPGPSTFLRRIARTLPAGNVWMTTNYGGTEGPIAAVCGVAAGTPQAGMPKQITGPAPGATGTGSARVEQFVYDAIGRRVGRRAATSATLASAGWGCTTYDTRGRVTSESYPANGTAVARTVTYGYAVGGSPFVNTVGDSTWGATTISSTVDMLSRTTSYTDINSNTTTTTFDQAGRVATSVSPIGTRAFFYSVGTTRLDSITLNTAPLAVVNYSLGRISSVLYGNGTSTTHSYDASGRPAGIGVFDNQGVTGDIVTRSAAGRVRDQQVFNGTAFQDAGVGVDNYIYDGAGRLTTARLPASTYTYGFGAGTGCAAPGAGANTNRASFVITGTGAQTMNSCYNAADQLVSTSQITAANITYDNHGNTTKLGTETYDFDSTDRHTRTESASNVTSYRRDPLDRISERTDRTLISHVATTTKTAAATSIAINRPTGTLTGDLMVASVTARATILPAAITSSGWTVARTQTNGLLRTSMLWRYATATDPTSWTFSIGSGITPTVTGAISTYRNAAPTNPVATSASSVGLVSNTHPFPPVTTTDDGQRLVHAVGLFGSTTPSTTTATSRAAVAAAASLLVADRYQSRPGASAAGSASSSLTLTSANITIALVPLTQVARYGFAERDDTPQFTKNTTGGFIDFSVALPGNTTYVITGAGVNYSHANVHGDAATVTNASGNRVWTGFTGPYGEPTSGSAPPNTNVSGTSWRWVGAYGRIADRSVVHMGARPYVPASGRFISVDPIEGGCANDYAFGYGDPLNGPDLNGRGAYEAMCGAAATLSYGSLVRYGYHAAKRANDKAQRALGPNSIFSTLLYAAKSVAEEGGLFGKILGGLSKIVAPVVVTATIVDAVCAGSPYFYRWVAEGVSSARP